MVGTLGYLLYAGLVLDSITCTTYGFHPILAGILFSLFIGGSFIHLVIEFGLFRTAVWRRKWDDPNDGYGLVPKDEVKPAYHRIKVGDMFPRPSYWVMFVLSGFERLGYTFSVWFCVPEFIAVWLAFKVATRWAHKSDIENGFPYKSERAAVYGNIYLIGTLLSVFFGVVGGLICRYGFCPEQWIGNACSTGTHVDCVCCAF